MKYEEKQMKRKSVNILGLTGIDALLSYVLAVVCPTCVSIYVSQNRAGSRIFRIGVYLFTVKRMQCWEYLFSAKKNKLR